ncbi:MAG: DUF1015 family protein, partial [Eubacteriales bacterium]|nr:DUF1015 family protein [Eubacteriales bacterium]
MNERFRQYGLGVPRILLPGPEVDPAKWAVVACDQYTAQPEWWKQAEALVGSSPSTLKLIHPEYRLREGEPDARALHEA